MYDTSYQEDQGLRFYGIPTLRSSTTPIIPRSKYVNTTMIELARKSPWYSHRNYETHRTIVGVLYQDSPTSGLHSAATSNNEYIQVRDIRRGLVVQREKVLQIRGKLRSSKVPIFL